MTVAQLAHITADILGVTPDIRHEAPRAGELARSALDASRAREVLGWEPRHTLEQGLAELVAWFEEVAA